MRVLGACVVAIVFAGCAKGDEGRNGAAATFGTPVGNETASASSGGGDSPVLSGTETDTDESSSSGSEDAGDTTGSESSSSGSSTGGDGSSGEAPVCIPDEDDNSCFVCSKNNCCPEVDACYESAICSCALDCLETGWDPQTCVLGCGLDTAVSSLVLCAATLCEPECDEAL